MEAYIYLIQNGDLFNIGTTRNLEKVQELLKPGKLCGYLKIKDAEGLCRNIYLRYSEARIPESNYFRLTKAQLLECQLMLKNEGGNKYFEPIFKGPTLFIIFFSAWVLLSVIIIKIGVDPILQRLV